MWPYWLFFIFVAFNAINSGPIDRLRPNLTRRIRIDESWVFVILITTLFMGLRYQVGGDWLAYTRIFSFAHRLDLQEVLLMDDPAYWLINWLVIQVGGGMAEVNLVLALIFSTSIAAYCLSLPRPWLTLAVAFPYLIVVVGMGYARQAIALSLVIVALLALEKGKFFRFAVWVILATTFHKTAIVMIGLGAMSVNTNRWLWIPIIGLLGLGAYTALLADYTDDLVYGYITREYESAGALIRLSMNLVPAVLFMIFRRRFETSLVSKNFWTVASLATIALFLALLAGLPSTALDRMALYLLPLQLFVFAHLPDVIGVRGRRNTELVIAIVAYYALVMFVWLNFGNMSNSWVPYKTWLDQ